MASDTSGDKLLASSFQRLHPRTYLERLLAEGVRPDGRLPEEWRDMSVNVGSISTANGSSLVRLGETTVVCGVKAEIAQPELDAPNHGYIVPNLDLTSMSSPIFKSGPPSDEAQVLSDRLHEALTGVVPLDSLCIHPGKAVWTLYIDAICINYDGNPFDATLIAMVSALKNASIPKATYAVDTGKTLCSRKECEELQMARLPAAYTIGVFNDVCIYDPTSFEEPLLDRQVTVILDEEHKLLSVSENAGSGRPGREWAKSCIEAAKRQHMLVADTLYK